MTVWLAIFASYSVDNATDYANFGTYLESFVKIPLTSTSRRPAISHVKLAKCWGIQPIGVKAAVQQTTQRGVYTIANPKLS